MSSSYQSVRTTELSIRLGRVVERMWEDLRRRRYLGRVSADVASADAGTPSFFINGLTQAA